MAQRRGVRRVAPLFECCAGRSQLLPTAPGAVDENDVLVVAHETKDDSQCASRCLILASRAPPSGDQADYGVGGAPSGALGLGGGPFG